MEPPTAGWEALSVKELKAELWERRGISHAGCVEKRDLLALLEASERHRESAPPPKKLPPGPPGPAPLAAPSRATLLAVLRRTLQLESIEVEYVDHAGRALALTAAAAPLSLEDAPPSALALYAAGRERAYRAAAAPGAVAQLLALPAAERVGSDASTALLAYRGPSLEQQHGHPLFAKFRVDVHAFDEEWDFDFSKPAFTDDGYDDGVHLRGGLRYRRPLGWVRFALNVDRFETSRWLGSMGEPGEWAVAYHGTSGDAVAPIVKDGLRQPRTRDEKRHGALHGEGVYLTPHAEVAAEFARAVPIDSGDGVRHFQVVFQCRVRPGAYSCHRDPLYGDVFVVGSEADVRPYGMLLGECSADGVPSQAWSLEKGRVAARSIPRAAPAGRFWDEFWDEV